MDHQPFSTPLLCWDIFLQGYRSKIALSKDLRLLNQFSKKNSWNEKWDLEDILIKKERVVIVTAPSQSIAFASSNLLVMNGYLPAEVIGHTPRIFQGRETDQVSKSLVRKAIVDWKSFKTTILNYRKNGLPYLCKIEGFPVFNLRDELVHFIAFEKIAEGNY